MKTHVAEQLRALKASLGAQVDWRKRCAALDALLALVREQAAQSPDAALAVARALRIVDADVADSLGDLRSVVVKDACHVVAEIGRVLGELARSFAKRLAPELLKAIGVSNRVMAGLADECMRALLKTARMRGALPLIVDELRTSRAREVREFCVDYVALVLHEWPTPLLAKFEAPLYDGIVHALGDATPRVREKARAAVASFRVHFPQSGERLFASLDERTQKLIPVVDQPVTPRTPMPVDQRAAVRIQSAARGFLSRKAAPALKLPATAARLHPEVADAIEQHRRLIDERAALLAQERTLVEQLAARAIDAHSYRRSMADVLARAGEIAARLSQLFSP